MTDKPTTDHHPGRATRPAARSRLKRAGLAAMQRAGLFRLASRLGQPAIPILCYHGIWMMADAFQGDAMFMRPETFRQRMQLIKLRGRTVIALADAVAMLRAEGRVPTNAVVITIDDGWYGTWRHMLPVLREYGFPATLYCDTAQLLRGGVVAHVMARYVRMVEGREPLSSEAEAAYQVAVDVSLPDDARRDALGLFAKAAGIDLAPYAEARAFEYMSAVELRQFADAGMSVELHTHNHTLGDLGRETLAGEVESNRAALAGILGGRACDYRHFCYPSGVWNHAIASHLGALGIESATTTVMDVARTSAGPHLLPRILDGGQMTDVEFEAELNGVAAMLRRAAGR